MTALAPAIGWNPWAPGTPCRVTIYLGDVFNPTPTTFRGTVQRVRQVLPGIRHVLVTIQNKAEAVEWFERYAVAWKADQIRAELRGKNLACYCKEGPCHADVLLRIANERSDQ